MRALLYRHLLPDQKTGDPRRRIHEVYLMMASLEKYYKSGVFP